MWTAELISTAPNQNIGMVDTVIRYTHTDGRTHDVEDHISDATSYKKIALDHLNELKRKDAADAAIKDLLENPPIGIIDLDPPAPTAEQIAARDLAQKRQQLIQLKQDQELADFVANNPSLSIDNPVSPLVNIASSAETVTPLISK